MGSAKALLRVEGETFLARTVRSLAEGGCDPVLVVVAENAAGIAAEAIACGATLLVNPDPGDGPITSLRLAIDSLDDEVDAIAYLPVDHPLVRPESVTALLRAAAESGQALTVPKFGPKRGHPAIFHRALFRELVDPALEGGARTVVHRHLASACIVQSDDPGVITDIDTPEDYDSALETTVDVP
jgi:molybdenum cofactor cytidylyltransferase